MDMFKTERELNRRSVLLMMDFKRLFVHEFMRIAERKRKEKLEAEENA